MQISRVGIEQPDLLCHRPRNARMTMSNERHVVINVEIGAARVVVEILLPSTHNLQRPAIRNAEIPTQHALSIRQRVCNIFLIRDNSVRCDTQQQIRIRRKIGPHSAFRSQRDAGKIRAPIQQIGDHLKMQMRRPATVFRHRSDAADALTLRDRLANLQLAQRFARQMPVQREKFFASSGTVAQNHNRPVIKRLRIIRERVNDSVQRRIHRTPRRNKQIDSEMNRAAFIRRIFRRAEKRRSVEQPRLVVSPDPDTQFRLAQLADDRLIQPFTLTRCGISAEKRAAHAKIENDWRRHPQINIKQRRRRTRMTREPLAHCARLRHRLQPANFSKRIVRKSRMHLRQPRQRFPRRLFRDRDVESSGLTLARIAEFTTLTASRIAISGYKTEISTSVSKNRE